MTMRLTQIILAHQTARDQVLEAARPLSASQGSLLSTAQATMPVSMVRPAQMMRTACFGSSRFPAQKNSAAWQGEAAAAVWEVGVGLFCMHLPECAVGRRM